MMEVVFVVKDKKEAKRILESDPYGEESFARVGYVLRENLFGENNVYLYLNASDDFIKKAEERLKGVVERADKDISEKVIKKIKEDESNVAAGISLFD